jgi:hypothetical protein
MNELAIQCVIYIFWGKYLFMFSYLINDFGKYYFLFLFLVKVYKMGLKLGPLYIKNKDP